MEKERFRSLVSEVQVWMDDLLAAHGAAMAPVAAAGFDRLSNYYPNSFLMRVQRVVVNRCPVPPLSVTGIPQLAEIETWDIKGVPWGNAIFIRRDLSGWDVVHFHELLHIAQWEFLGTERYLTAWAIGTILHGYRENPLEEMAFRYTEEYEANSEPFDVIREVSAELGNLPTTMYDVDRIQ